MDLNLTHATSLTIGYMLNGNEKHLVINDSKLVDEILGLLSIEKSIEGIQAPLLPNGTLKFHFKDKDPIRAMFVSKTNLDIAYWGQLFISENFYERVCELLSKEEKRPIDVLIDNP